MIPDEVTRLFKIARCISDCHSIAPAALHKLADEEDNSIDLTLFLKQGRELDGLIAWAMDLEPSAILWSRQ